MRGSHFKGMSDWILIARAVKSPADLPIVMDSVEGTMKVSAEFQMYQQQREQDLLEARLDKLDEITRNHTPNPHPDPHPHPNLG